MHRKVPAHACLHTGRWSARCILAGGQGWREGGLLFSVPAESPALLYFTYLTTICAGTLPQDKYSFLSQSSRLGKIIVSHRSLK